MNYLKVTQNVFGSLYALHLEELGYQKYADPRKPSRLKIEVEKYLFGKGIIGTFVELRVTDTGSSITYEIIYQ